MFKKFFYACAGLLCLALAYHVGAERAAAQTGFTIEGPALAQHGGAIDASGCVSRQLFVGGVQVVPVPVPGSSPIVATAVLANSNSPYGVMLANGDIYIFQNPGGWVLSGNAIGSPVQASQESWGQLKARYR